jgi:hypothetical protein
MTRRISELSDRIRDLGEEIALELERRQPSLRAEYSAPSLRNRA